MKNYLATNTDFPNKVETNNNSNVKKVEKANRGDLLNILCTRLYI